MVNGLNFDTWNRIPVNISTKLLEDVKSRRLKRKRVQDQFEIEQIEETEPDKRKKIPKEISTDSKPFSAVFVLDNKNSEMKLRVVRKEDAIFENQNTDSNVLSFQTHMCNMPFMFKPNKETTLKT
eukprot:UN15938